MTSKKFLIGMAVLLSASLFFLGCPTGGDDDPAPPAPSAVSEFVLNFAAPVTGEEPDAEIAAAAQYTGAIVWKAGAAELEADAVFEQETAYTAVVTLAPKGNYTLDGVAQNAFKYGGYGAVSAANAAGSGVVTVVFGKTGGTELAPVALDGADLKGFFDAPKVGETPDAAFDGNHQFSGTVVWKADAVELEEDAVFEGATVYTAVVTLTAKPTWTFAGVAQNAFTYTGATNASNPANSGTVTVVFPTTPGTTGNLAKIDALDLAGAIAKPATGAPASAVFAAVAPNSDQYTGGPVTWKKGADPVAAGTKFAEKTVYVASVTLTPNTGYTFAGAGNFVYAGATVTKTANENGSVTVTITFGVTATVVTALELSNAIAAPVTGGTPSNTFTVPGGNQYTGPAVVTWTPAIAEEGVFAANTEYTATVALTANAGYTFATLEDDAFTYTKDGVGDVEVAFDAATGVLAVTFKTAAVVSHLNLAEWLDAPVKNAPAVAALKEAAVQYTGVVAWKQGSTGFTGSFGAATEYTATVILTPKAGLFTFTGFAEGTLFTYAGLDPEKITTGAVANGTVTVTLEFPATADSESALAVTVNPVTLSSSTGSLAGITLTTDAEDADVTLTLTGDGVDTYKWYVDGQLVAEATTGVFVLSTTAGYRVTKHNVTVVASGTDGSYSETVAFTVLPAEPAEEEE